MTVHLVKLCVGIDSIEHLAEFRALRRIEQAKKGEPDESRHVTRMWPRRADEILDGGSLYWVIKGFISVRQAILRLDDVYDGEGIRYCGIVMAPALVRTRLTPRRPFQGWRYFEIKDAPPDLATGAGAEAQPPEDMARALRQLGLI